MKKIFKKNQIIVTVLAILIVIAGYLKYTDANFNNKNKEVTNEIYESTYGTDDILSNGEIASLDENETGEAVEETTLQPGEAVMTSSKLTDFIIQARISISLRQYFYNLIYLLMRRGYYNFICANICFSFNRFLYLCPLLVCYFLFIYNYIYLVIRNRYNYI